jgi:heme O synthase-like polyprenyltransferase
VDSDKDRFDALMKLAEFKRAIRDSRRQFEWRFTATAFIALAGLTVTPQRAPVYVIAIAVIAIWIIHTYWVFWNSSRNEQDAREMHKYSECAEQLLPAEMRQEHKRGVPPWGAYFQIGTAFLVGFFTLAVRYFSP